MTRIHLDLTLDLTLDLSAADGTPDANTDEQRALLLLMDLVKDGGIHALQRGVKAAMRQAKAAESGNEGDHIWRAESYASAASSLGYALGREMDRLRGVEPLPIK